MIPDETADDVLPEHAKCPWCGELVPYPWELFNAAEDVVRVRCLACGEPIRVLREIKIRYSAIKDKVDEVQDLLDESVPGENLPAGA